MPKNNLRCALLFGVIASAIALLLSMSGILDSWENVFWKWRVRLLAEPSEVTSRIKIIAVDDASLEWMQEENQLSWQWPRQVYSGVISFCKRGGAKALGFDVIFELPSTYGAEDDSELAKAIHSGPPYVQAVMLTREKGGVPQIPAALSNKVPGVADADSFAKAHSIRAAAIRLPIEPIAGACTYFGNVRQDPDSDGTMRHIDPVYFLGNTPVPGFAFSLAVAGGQGELAFRGHNLYVGDSRIPRDDMGSAIIRYRGGAGTYQTLSAAEIIRSELLLSEGGTPSIDPGVFKDAYVIFALTATALHDLKVTPLSDKFPGTEVHATVLDNILANDFLSHTPLAIRIASLLVLACLSVFLLRQMASRMSFSVLVAFAFVALPFLISLPAYQYGLWWPVMEQTLAVFVASASALSLNYFQEHRERRFIEQAFQHYLSPEVIRRLVGNPSSLRLGGERRELSIFFSDLQGFTTISEKLEPHDLTVLLNDYLSDMTDIILDSGGTLDKYEGDAIIAFWNAPLNLDDHPLRAVGALLQCQQKLASRREEFFKREGVELHMRIGLHTGPVVVGNMGSHRRFDYTMLGDAANLAARLEGANKVFGTYSMISEATEKRVRDVIISRELGLIRVVGRNEPVRVFEPLGLIGEISPDIKKEYNSGLALCREGDFSKALAVFEKLPDDPAAVVYAQKCRDVLAQPDPQWDTVWNLTSK